MIFLFFFLSQFDIIYFMKTYHFVVSGRVQGVAFRYYTVKNAVNNRIRGTVQNLGNGDVEVYAQGDDESIKRFENFLRSGPPSARVEYLLKEEINTSELFQGFEIIY